MSTLGLFGLWPVAHRVLVTRFHVDPWRFGGWAMYCAPPGTVSVSVSALVRGAVVDVPMERLPPPLVEMARDYTVVARAAGTLVPPAPLGKAVLQELPEAEQVKVVVTRQYFDVETARFRERLERYVYPR